MHFHVIQRVQYLCDNEDDAPVFVQFHIFLFS